MKLIKFILVEDIRQQAQKLENFSETYPQGNRLCKQAQELVNFSEICPQENRLCRGFTLAEVLITLGIIGVVAAMTLPVLIQKQNTKILESQFKKSYSNAAQALLTTKFALGVDNLQQNFAIFDESNEVYTNSDKFIKEYYKQMKVVQTKNYSSPPLNYVKTKNFQTDAITCLPINILPDGSSMCTNIWSSTISVTVDVNGPDKKPNAFGHDIFMFQITKSGKLLPMGAPNTTSTRWSGDYKNYCKAGSTNVANGFTCAYRAMTEKDYFKNLPKS